MCEGERKGEDVGKDGGKDCSCALESVLYSEFGHQKQDMLREGQGELLQFYSLKGRLTQIQQTYFSLLVSNNNK